MHCLTATLLAATLVALGSSLGGPAAAQHGHGGAATYRIGDLIVTAPWTRATPKGARVAGGYLTIANTGSEPDRLIGGSLAVAERFEIHRTTMDDGVMRMRPVADGLEIKPGDMIELRPGGYHLMFVGLKQPLRAGDVVRGMLQFARAGTLEVVYRVEAPGTTAPAAGHPRQH